MSVIKRMTPKEFREQGYLRELNRQFLHPLGLALEMVIEKIDGKDVMVFGQVQDYRDDPEGMYYGDEVLRTELARKQAEQIEALRKSKAEVRRASLGYEIQPIPEPQP
jgi:hypothetical protein